MDVSCCVAATYAHSCVQNSSSHFKEKHIKYAVIPDICIA